MCIGYFHIPPLKGLYHSKWQNMTKSDTYSVSVSRSSSNELYGRTTLNTDFLTADALRVSILYNVALYGINQNIEDDNEEIYDLIANIVHDGDPKDGTYRVHILHTETGTWKEIQVFTVVTTL